MTRPEAIRYVMDIDSGSGYDSAFIQTIVKRRLLSTNLFLKVAILPVIKNNTVDLYVVVKESFYFNPAGTGIDYNAYRFGKLGNWWSGRMGLELKNFRGRMETLRISAKTGGLEYPYMARYYTDIHPTKLSVKWLEWQGLGVSWSKPLFPSRYLIGLGGMYDLRPDELNPYIHSELASRLSVGRKFFERSQGMLSIIPDFRKNDLQQTADFDSTARDTTIFEFFTSAAWSLDRRQRIFDPSKGWSLGLDVRSNFLYHGIDSGFTQFSGDIRYYQPLFWADHKLAFRMRSIVRTHDGGDLNRVMTGGEGSVRGYLPSQIGLSRRWIGNDAFLFSSEYRFPLYYVPAIPLPEFTQSMLSMITGGDQYFSFRLDGALIADYGRVAGTFHDLMSNNDNPRHSGLGIGCGLRLMEIQKMIRASFDIVWPDNLYTKQTDFLWNMPGYYLYLATYY